MDALTAMQLSVRFRSSPEEIDIFQFHVCKNTTVFSPKWRLANGLMSPHAHIGNGFITTDLAPIQLAIWLNNVNGSL